MSLQMSVNSGDDFAKDIEELITLRVEKLDPRKVSGEVGEAMKKLDQFLEELYGKLVYSGVSFEKLLEFGEIEDLLTGLIFKHEKSCYKNGFCDGLRFYAGLRSSGRNDG